MSKSKYEYGKTPKETRVCAGGCGVVKEVYLSKTWKMCAGCFQKINGQRLGKLNIGKAAWNDGLTKETDTRVAKYSVKLSGKRKPLSEEHKQKLRIKRAVRIKQKCPICDGIWEKLPSNPAVCCSKECGQKLTRQTRMENGYKHSDNTKQKISIGNTGKNLGKKSTKGAIEKRTKTIAENAKKRGYYWSEETNHRRSLAMNEGKTPLEEKIRKIDEYVQWRKDVFTRDDYTCQDCFTRGGKLNAHHNRKKFSEILSEFLQHYSQFSPVEEKEILVRLAITYPDFWDVTNGKTLCKKCHDETKKRMQNVSRG